MTDPAIKHNDVPQEEFLAAQRLARNQGLVVCRKCGDKTLIEHQLTAQYGGAIAVAMCPKCLVKYDLIVSMNDRGLQVLMKPRGIITVG